MRQKRNLLFVATLFIISAASGQGVSSDSLNTLNNNNKMLRMAISINEQKIQLAKLQNQLIQQNYTAEKTAEASQASAAKNAVAATTLSNDDQDKGKANDARRSARKAEHNSSQARHAQDKMGDLSRDVQVLEKKIADSQQALTAIGGSRYLQ